MIQATCIYCGKVADLICWIAESGYEQRRVQYELPEGWYSQGWQQNKDSGIAFCSMDCLSDFHTDERDISDVECSSRIDYARQQAKIWAMSSDYPVRRLTRVGTCVHTF